MTDAGHYRAAAIPNCHGTFYPDEGHISTLLNHAEEILTALAELQVLVR